MKWKTLFGFVLFCSMAFNLQAQNLPDYSTRTSFLLAPASTFQYGLLGAANPALPAFIPKLETRFLWNRAPDAGLSPNRWGILTGGRGFGFQLLKQKTGAGWMSDYGLSAAFRQGSWGAGVGLHWSRAEKGIPRHDRFLSVGWVFRPNRYASLGASGHFSLNGNTREGVLEAGVRPLGTTVFTLFGDLAVRNHRKMDDSNWSAGAALRILPGIYAVGRYFDTKSATVGISINLGHLGAAGQTHISEKGEWTSQDYIVRVGGLLENVLSGRVQKKRRYVSLWPKGSVVYQTYQFGDKSVHSFFDLLNTIRKSATDPRVSAMVLNLSDVTVQPENAWEIREALRRFRQKGKKVIIFMENAGITTYHLASVADWVVMDPLGSLALEGLVMGRTFYKGALEKLGVGFDELRFFKYKSAVEPFSRKNMSEADRAQRQAFVNDWYQLIRSDVCRSRKLKPEKFDELVNRNMIFLADSARKAGLVDTLARWTNREKVVKALLGKKLRPVQVKKLIPNEMVSSAWGQRPQIALVYALGDCAMNTGIRARRLEKIFKKLEKTKSVKAVVFRVDSPGGDGMASDLVAEAMKSCAKKKPVIVSQGQIAGSGGYWISMNADTIVAGPNTITGSIGVIGGWLYDKGFSGKIGFTADHVKRGKHADVGFGVSIPFLGMLPERDLTKEERGTVKHFMETAYGLFVQKVAAGRSLPVDSVKQIAQGHVYSGVEGKKIGLVDVIGGVEKAIQIAKKKAGFRPSEKVNIVEIPKYKGLFKSPLPKLPFAGVGSRNQYQWNFLRMVAQFPGKPLFLTPPESLPILPLR